MQEEIFNEIKRISVKKPVILIYNDEEFNATKTINYYLGSEKNNKNISFTTNNEIKSTRILFEPFLKIDIEEKIIGAFGKAISYKSGILDFDFVIK